MRWQDDAWSVSASVRLAHRDLHELSRGEAVETSSAFATATISGSRSACVPRGRPPSRRPARERAGGASPGCPRARPASGCGSSAPSSGTFPRSRATPTGWSGLQRANRLQATANETATFVCVNNGGQCPNAANKQTVAGPASGTGEFSSGKTGSISRCIIIPGFEAPDFCPGGQTETLDLIAYADITITDTTNDVSEVATPSSVSADPFDCP
jgi:hypothetical protein